MRSLRPLAASGLSNLSNNLTPLPDDGPPLSSGLYGASSGLSGSLRRYERGSTGESGRRGIGRWCSGSRHGVR